MVTSASARRHEFASARRRDAAFAAFLTLVLSAGVLGVLLLNTATQQQSVAMSHAHARLAALADELQALQAQLDWAADPAALAARAQRLQLRPVKRVDYVRLGPSGVRSVSRVSVRTPAGGRGHAG